LKNLSRKQSNSFWNFFFGVDLGDIVEIDVQSHSHDDWHRVHVEIIVTYPDPCNVINRRGQLRGRVIKDFDNVGLRNSRYTFHASRIKRLVKKWKR